MKLMPFLSQLALVLFLCGCSLAPIETLTASLIKTPSYTPTPGPTPLPPNAAHGLGTDFSLVYEPGLGIWTVQSEDGVIVATQDRGSDVWIYDFTDFVSGKSIDVFDANTFPHEFLGIAQNWLEAANLDWNIYQAFVEAARNEFFKQEGISDEVAGLEDINPDLRSLWGVIYWTQVNRDRVIEEQLMPVVTPKEIRIILEQFPGRRASWDPFGNPRYAEQIFLLDGTSVYREWGFQFFFDTLDGPWYKSSEVGKIIGRDDIVIAHDPANTVFGDLAVLARFFSDMPDPILVLTHLKLPPESVLSYRHTLFAQMATFDESYTLPQGTICRAWDTTIIPKDCSGCQGTERKFELPFAYSIGPLVVSTSNKAVTLDDLFSRFGDSIAFEPPLMREAGPWVIDGVVPEQCLDPALGMEIAGRTYIYKDQETNLYPYAWPWQGHPPFRSWDFANLIGEGAKDGWVIEHAVFEVEDGRLVLNATGNDARIISPELEISADLYPRIQIRMRVSAGDEGMVGFTAKSQSGTVTTAESIFLLKPDEFFHTYTLDMAANSDWTGEIQQLQIFPADAESKVEIEYIHFIGPYDFEFEEAGDSEGWVPASNTSDFRVSILRNSQYGTQVNRASPHEPWGSLTFMSTGTDPAILSPTLSIDAQKYTQIQLGMKVPYCALEGQLFFITSEDLNFDKEKSATFSIDKWNLYQPYLIDMSTNSSWVGDITQVRLEPMQCRGVIEVDFIRFISDVQ